MLLPPPSLRLIAEAKAAAAETPLLPLALRFSSSSSSCCFFILLLLFLSLDCVCGVGVATSARHVGIAATRAVSKAHGDRLLGVPGAASGRTPGRGRHKASLPLESHHTPPRGLQGRRYESSLSLSLSLFLSRHYFSTCLSYISRHLRYRTLFQRPDTI